MRVNNDTQIERNLKFEEKWHPIFIELTKYFLDAVRVDTPNYDNEEGKALEQSGIDLIVYSRKDSVVPIYLQTKMRTIKYADNHDIDLVFELINKSRPGGIGWEETYSKNKDLKYLVYGWEQKDGNAYFKIYDAQEAFSILNYRTDNLKNLAGRRNFLQEGHDGKKRDVSICIEKQEHYEVALHSTWKYTAFGENEIGIFEEIK